MGDSSAPVVVGTDGSPPSRGAVRWAADHAAIRGRSLRIVHAAASPDQELWAEARACVASAVAAARRWHPELTVTGDTVDGQPITELCTASEHAELVVVAARGLGGFDGLLLGSVAGQVTLHARGAVAIVHDAQRWADLEDSTDSSSSSIDDRPVVVGVDNSSESGKAITAAFAAANAMGVPVIAVRVMQPHSVGRHGKAHQRSVKPATEDAERYALAEALTSARATYPMVEVHTQLATGNPAGALIAAATQGQLLVIGSRGHGGFTGLRLGANTHQLIQHAGCPLMIVRQPAADTADRSASSGDGND